jgi:eukaryotic-like serine/threonine-protein kinase
MNSATQSFLGRYRLVKVLGQGAMGVVYEAVDTRLNRAVAIKTVLRSHMVDETTAGEYATRFEREAQAAARLSHPHVVTVFDFGEHEDISYIVMEFIRGRELNQAFEAGEKFPLPEAIRIMCELLQALDYAHQQGIVHRDIKPANVMLDGADRVKLTDFGVARVANANQDRTMPGTLVGTPSYMSPEQILGLAVGSRADIFATGVILYQFLTGKRPFTGGGPFGVQRKIVQDDPIPPSQANPEVPQGFDLIIARALAKQPEDRYENAAAFAADLERIGSTLPRAVPRIDLDLPAADPAGAQRTAPATAPTSASAVPPAQMAAPQAPPPAGEAAALTLITAVPFGEPQPPQTPGLDDAAGSEDPEATVIMFRPTAPDDHGTRPPATRPPTPAVQTPASTASVAAGQAATQGQRPAAAPPAGHQPPAPSSPAGPAAPAVRPAAPTQRPRAEPAQNARIKAAPPPAAASRNLLPLAAGAGVAVLGLTAWLLLARPWAGDAARPGEPPPTPTVAPAAISSPGPTPAPAPAPAPTSTTTGSATSGPEGSATTGSKGRDTAAPAAVAAPAPTPAPASPAVTAAPTTPKPAPRAAPPRPARPDPQSDAGTVRRQPADPAARPPAVRDEPRSDRVATRCSDLLQRMQLGEPLSPEQTSYFQSRCTR